ncbi:RICIN domain-containing protein [Crocosphaera sp. Alani8]|uniref:RICIN domain-containing protein n=1 Tax=Crocosphaera sp. Alani8 TaxID=3038952 RepID=UPI00313D5FC6
MAARTVKFVNKKDGLLLDTSKFGTKGICLTHSQLNEKVLHDTSQPITKSQQWLIDDDGVITNFEHDTDALTYDPANSKPLSLQPISNKTDHQKWVLHDNGSLQCLGGSNDSFLQGKPDSYDNPGSWLQSFFPNQQSTDDVEYQPLEDLTKKNLQADEQWEIRYVDNDELCNDLLKDKSKTDPKDKSKTDNKVISPVVNYKKVEKISMPTDSLGPMHTTRSFDFPLPESRPDIPIEDIRLQHLSFNMFHTWLLGGIRYEPILYWINLKNPGGFGGFGSPGHVISPNYGYNIRPDQYITKITGLWTRSRTSGKNASEITAFGTLNLVTNDGASYGFPSTDDNEEGSGYRHLPNDEYYRVGRQFPSLLSGSGGFDSMIEKIIPITIEAPQGHEIISLYGTFTQPLGLDLSNAMSAWKRELGCYIGTLGIYTRPAKN